MWINLLYVRLNFLMLVNLFQVRQRDAFERMTAAVFDEIDCELTGFIQQDDLSAFAISRRLLFQFTSLLHCNRFFKSQRDRRLLIRNHLPLDARDVSTISLNIEASPLNEPILGLHPHLSVVRP